MRKTFISLGLIFSFAISHNASAAVMTIWGDTADAAVEMTQGIFPGYAAANGGIVGVNGGYDYSNVYVFQLPSLDPTRQAILTANFSFYDSSNSAQYKVDLYGLGYRAASTVLNSDWYSGANDTSNTLIQPGIIPASDTTFQGRISTNAVSDTSLLNYLQAQYADGATGGDYVFLRLSLSQASAPNLNVDFVDNADLANYLVGVQPGTTLEQWQDEFSPELNLTITPEPGAMLSLPVALIAGIGLRVRRRK